MRGAGWGPPASREGFSERDPALDDSRGNRRLPLPALAIAVAGYLWGLIGSIAIDTGPARFELTVTGGFARAGYAVAILAGLWISFGSRDRAQGAYLIGWLIVVGTVITLLITS